MPGTDQFMTEATQIPTQDHKEQLEKEIVRLQQQIQKLENNHTIKSRDLNRVSKDLKTAEKQLTDLLVQIQEMQKIHQALNLDVIDSEQRKKQTIKAHEQEIAESKQRTQTILQNSTAQEVKLQQALDTYQPKIDAVEKQCKEEVAAHEANRTQQIKEFEAQTKQQISEKQQEIIIKTSELATIQRRIQLAESKLAKTNKEIAQAEQESQKATAKRDAAIKSAQKNATIAHQASLQLIDEANQNTKAAEEKATIAESEAEKRATEAKAKSEAEIAVPSTELTATNMRKSVRSSFLAQSFGKYIQNHIGIDLENEIHISIQQNLSPIFIHSSNNDLSTLFGYYLKNKYWSNYTQGSTIPLAISQTQSEISPHSIEEALTKRYGFKKQDIAARSKGHNNTCLLIILNIHNGVSSENFLPSLNMIMQDWPNTGIVVVSSTEFFNDIHSTQSHLVAYELTELDEHQIKHFIFSPLLQEKETTDNVLFIAYIDQISLSQELLELYFTLSILIEALTSSKEDKLLKETIFRPHKQETSAICETASNITRHEGYARLMAYFMPKIKKLLVNFNQINFTYSYTRALELFIFKLDIKKIAKDIMTENIGKNPKNYLGNPNKMLYPLTYTIMQEFLVSNKILSELRELCLDPSKKLSKESILNKDYIQKHPSVAHFILDAISAEETKTLERIITSTSEDTGRNVKSPISIASANAATLYVRASNTNPIEDKDWSHTQIMGADLSDAHFRRMHFVKSDWSNVRAQSTQIHHSACEAMNLSGMDSSFPYIFSGSSDNTIRAWDIETGKCLKVLKGHTSWVSSIYASGPYIFSGSYDNTIKIWDIENEKCIKELIGHTAAIMSIYANGPYIFSGGYDMTVIIWDIANNTSRKLAGHSGAITSVHARRYYAFSGSSDNTVRIWDISTGNCLKVIKGDSCCVSNIYTNDNYLFLGHDDKTVRVWDIKSGKKLRILGRHEGAVLSIYVRNSYIFSGSSDNTIKIWDIASGKYLKTLKGHTGFVNSLYATESYLFSGSSDNTIKIWNIESGKCVNTLEGHENLVNSVHASIPLLSSKLARNKSLNEGFKFMNNQTNILYGVSQEHQCIFTFNGFKGNFIKGITLKEDNSISASNNQAKENFIDARNDAMAIDRSYTPLSSSSLSSTNTTSQAPALNIEGSKIPTMPIDFHKS